MVAGGPGLGSLPFGVVGEVAYRVILAHGVIVPMSAISSADNRNVVYLVEDGKVAVRPVEVVAESGAAAVVKGLVRGSVVIVSPPPGLVPGAQVQAIPAKGIDLGPGVMAGGAPQGTRGQRSGPSGQGSAPAQAGRP
jgi:hypothetical protein